LADSFARDIVIHHLDLLFNINSSDILTELHFIYSKKTGRIKSFGSKDFSFGTLRSDGGIALTIEGAQALFRTIAFRENCVIPKHEAIPFIREGKSLFCKHILWIGSNIKVGSECVVIDNDGKILAIGKSLIYSLCFKSNVKRGIAIKIRKGLKSRAINE
jgi:uncharacterized protein with predicted RNA binding PUA domain